MAHYFIGIQLPKTLQHFYSHWQKELESKLSYKRWMHMEDLHITLKFLGEADEAKVDFLQDKLSHSTLPINFQLHLSELGIFGANERPRVLLVNVRPSAKLLNLQSMVSETALESGFSKENRAFHPHMTLAKKWKADTSLPEGFISSLQQEFPVVNQFTVSHITLYRIHPGHEPSYEKVAIFQ